MNIRVRKPAYQVSSTPGMESRRMAIVRARRADGTIARRMPARRLRRFGRGSKKAIPARAAGTMIPEPLISTATQLQMRALGRSCRTQARAARIVAASIGNSRYR